MKVIFKLDQCFSMINKHTNLGGILLKWIFGGLELRFGISNKLPMKLMLLVKGPSFVCRSKSWASFLWMHLFLEASGKHWSNNKAAGKTIKCSLFLQCQDLYRIFEVWFLWGVMTSNAEEAEVERFYEDL